MLVRACATSLLITACALVTVPVDANAQSPTRYRVLELGFDVYPSAINNQGIVAAWGAGQPNQGIGRNGFFIDGATGALTIAQNSELFYDINDSGTAFGLTSSYSPGLWRSNGEFVDLSDFGPIYSAHINDAGHIAGHRPYAQGSYDETEGVVLRDGVLTTLDRLGAENRVSAINNNGQVVGAAGTHNFSMTASSWSADGAGTLLPGLGGTGESSAMGINEAGAIVGYVPGDTLGTHRAVKWEDGMVVDLVTNALSAEAIAINNSGDIVGGFTDVTGTSTFLWTKGRLINLNDVLIDYEGHVSRVFDINDKGWIIGSVGFDVGVVLIPIPEPGAIVMVVAGLGIVLLCRRRRAQA